MLTTVIIVAKRMRMNPDNLATPLAASIGDLVSLSLLSVIASLLYANIETKFWINYVVIIIYLCLLPLWILIVLRNKFTRHVLKSGWVPVISALFISGYAKLSNFSNNQFPLRTNFYFPKLCSLDAYRQIEKFSRHFAIASL